MTRTHLKNPISAAMTGFSAASRSSLLTIAKLFLIGLHSFRSKIPHFATKAIFEMGFKNTRIATLGRLHRQKSCCDSALAISLYLQYAFNCLIESRYGFLPVRTPLLLK